MVPWLASKVAPAWASLAHPLLCESPLPTRTNERTNEHTLPDGTMPHPILSHPIPSGIRTVFTVRSVRLCCCWCWCLHHARPSAQATLPRKKCGIHLSILGLHTYRVHNQLWPTISIDVASALRCHLPSSGARDTFPYLVTQPTLPCPPACPRALSKPGPVLPRLVL